MVVVRHGERSRLVQRGECRVGLDGQLIERKVIRRMRQCRAQFVAPAGPGLTGTAVDQIERHPREHFARKGHRLHGLI